MALTKVTGQVIKNTTDVTVGVLTVTNTLAVGGTVSIGGTLTYEDVTNVDAVGIITARSNILVGSGITLSPDGDIFATGISTFSEGFAGDILIDDKIVHRGDTNTAIRFADADTITAETGGSESFRVDSSQRLLLGHTSSQTIGSNSHGRSQINVTANQPVLTLSRFENVSAGPSLVLGKSRAGSAGSYTVVQDDDGLGSISFAGADGTDLVTVGANIEAQVDGTPGSNDMPTRLVFATTADGASSPTERLRITAAGLVGINETPTISQFQVKSAQLGGTSGDTQEVLRLYSPDVTNTTSYRFTNYRTSNGTSHVTSEMRFRRHVDATDMGFFGLGDGYVNFGYGTTEKARITSNGSVGVLNSDPKAQLHVNSTKNAETDKFDASNYHLVLRNPEDDNGEACGLAFAITSNATKIGAAIMHERDAGGSEGSLQFYTNDNGTSVTERVRITAGGDIDIAEAIGQAISSKVAIQHSGINPRGLFVLSSHASYQSITMQSACSRNTTNGSYRHFQCSINGVADKLQIMDSGDVKNTNNSYGSLSDANLKENIVDASSQWDDIKALRIRKFNFKEGVDPAKPTLLGVVAQEAELVCPNLVTSEVSMQEGEEKEYKTFKYSVLYMKAIKCLQEAQAKIETLESKVAALEG